MVRDMLGVLSTEQQREHIEGRVNNPVLELKGLITVKFHLKALNVNNP